jgi:hypothetical protein
MSFSKTGAEWVVTGATLTPEGDGLLSSVGYMCTILVSELTVILGMR